ncbi:MAG: nitrogenase component 1 [Ferrovum myxofaciens]
MQQYCTGEDCRHAATHGQEVVSFNHPVGVAGTDKFLMEISRITGKAIPALLTKERGRLVDAIADSSAHIHGRSLRSMGILTQCLGLAAFLMELGAEPVHVLSTNGE